MPFQAQDLLALIKSLTHRATDMETQCVPSVTHTATQLLLHPHSVTPLHLQTHGSQDNIYLPTHTYTRMAEFNGCLELWAITTCPLSLPPAGSLLRGSALKQLQAGPALAWPLVGV